MLLLSLGYSCQVAYQIRRYTKKDDAFFYDWLISEHDSYKSLFVSDELIFCRNNWEITDLDGIRVLDKQTGLKYQHEFETIPGTSIVDPNKVDAHLNSARSKSLHLKAKTIKAIADSKSVYMVRYESIQELEVAVERAKDIYSFFYSQCRNDLQVVIVSADLDRELITDDFLILKLKKSCNWEGDDHSYDRVFKKISEHMENIVNQKEEQFKNIAK